MDNDDSGFALKYWQEQCTDLRLHVGKLQTDLGSAAHWLRCIARGDFSGEGLARLANDLAKQFDEAAGMKPQTREERRRAEVYMMMRRTFVNADEKTIDQQTDALIAELDDEARDDG